MHTITQTETHTHTNTVEGTLRSNQDLRELEFL